jgi:hypothetical protein
MASVLDTVGESFGMRDDVIADTGRWGREIRSAHEKLFFERTCKSIWPRNSSVEGSDHDYSESGYTPHYRDSLKELARNLVIHSRGLYRPSSILKENPSFNDDSPGFQNAGQGSSLQYPILPTGIAGGGNITE